MSSSHRERLLAAAASDVETRARLAADGALFDGYNPEMQAVHDANAAMLRAMIEQDGWPDAARVGEDGAEAAWLIAQHAIAQPDFQRSCLDALGNSDAPAWQAAMLEDRIRVHEGRLQLYGSSFDWDADGVMSPRPIEDPDGVDQRRAAVGLPSLAEAIERHRAGAEPPPTDLAARDDAYRRWLVAVGWRVAEEGAID